jgi:hypothetical protein
VVGVPLAAGGIFAVVCYDVGRQTTRPASGWRLGATCHDVIGLVLRHGVALIVGGLAIGFADVAVVTQVAQRALLKFVWVEIG